MPIPEVLEWLERANKIDRQMQQEYDAAIKRGK
jgi:hypothetical protein